MENEILWKWELLCDEFEEAKQNYIEIVSPVISCLTKVIEGNECLANSAQLKNAQETWKNWVDVQNKIKMFMEDNA